MPASTPLMDPGNIFFYIPKATCRISDTSGPQAAERSDVFDIVIEVRTDGMLPNLFYVS